MADSRHKGREGAHKGHEAGDDDGDAAIALVKRMGSVVGVSVEPTRMTLQQACPKVATNQVVALVAQDRGNQHQGQHQGQVQKTRTGHRAHHKQQRVAWQKWHEDHPSFDKNDEEQKNIDPNAISMYKGFKVAVNVENEINEGVCDGVRNSIARDNTNILLQSYTLLEPIELMYYKDNKTRFGLPFLNGFFYFDEIDLFAIKRKDYSQVNGFFSPHQTQKREFEYTNEKGNFETFIERISTGEKEFNSKDEVHTYSVKAFNSMIGYLAHNYKSLTESPCIVLTDEGANDEHRNGRRGKTLISIALQNVTKTMVKGGNEYRSDYIHNFADLDKSYNLYLLDDIPASFNFNDLYTNITGGINVQPKGTKGVMIEFEDSPKFLMTSNWLLRYDEKNASTNSRFIEYKVKPYYNSVFTPKDEFNQTFFEDWDLTEWSKFYSYIFRCVHSYLKDGLTRITYDKTRDNYLVAFGSEVKESEMARIIDILINQRKLSSFSVTDFIGIYNHFENNLRYEKFFTHRNSRDLINTYLQNLKENRFIYNLNHKRWFKE